MADSDTIATIKTQALERLEEITASPKPSYMIDGQSVQWSAYQRMLMDQVEWCNKQLAGESPFEIHTIGFVR